MGHADLDLPVHVKSVALDFRDRLAEVLLEVRATGEEKCFDSWIGVQRAQNRVLQPVLSAIAREHGDTTPRHRRSSRMALRVWIKPSSSGTVACQPVRRRSRVTSSAI